MRLASVVILYHPDNSLLKNIQSYIDFSDKLFIIDNTESEQPNEVLLKSLSNYKNIVYIHDDENKGIAIRLNQAADLALAENFHWLLTMDQDSYFPTNTVPVYLNCIEGFENKEVTAMFGVQFLNENETPQYCNAKEVNHLITSGSIVNLKLIQKIGYFDEALFIDKVDHEYCLRAGLHNYKIIQFDNIFLHHNLGHISYGRSLKNFKLTPRVLHSPIRMYYIIRNYFYLKNKYKGEFKESFKEMQNELKNRTKNNLIYGTQKIKLLKYLVKGFIDYKKGVVGKLSESSK